jgi:hypothetical protein
MFQLLVINSAPPAAWQIQFRAEHSMNSFTAVSLSLAAAAASERTELIFESKI